MSAVNPYREKPPRPPKEVTCARCGIKFLIKTYGRGKIKYCVECRVIIYDEHHKEMDKKRREMRRANNA